MIKLREPAQAERRKNCMPNFATQARVNRPIAAMTLELEEFVDEILSMRLPAASYALALWQRDTKQRIKLDQPAYFADMTTDNYKSHYAQSERCRKFGLISMFAFDKLDREKAGVRHARHKEKEAQEAAALNIDVTAYQRRKRAVKAIATAAATPENFGRF